MRKEKIILSISVVIVLLNCICLIVISKKNNVPYDPIIANEAISKMETWPELLPKKKVLAITKAKFNSDEALADLIKSQNNLLINMAISLALSFGLQVYLYYCNNRKKE